MSIAVCLALWGALAGCPRGDEVSTDGDPDGDGLDRAAEQAAGTDPLKPDSDGDALRDGDEVSRGTDPRDPDSDDDGLADGREVALGTDPRDADSDDDTLLDGAEVNEHGSSPTAVDTDGDRISDPQEVNTLQTDPASADTDHDSLNDYDEVLLLNTDPLSADGDGDGLEDALEVVRGTHPRNADTDRDGIPDGVEAFETGTDPAAFDTDGDLLGDADELLAGTSPVLADSDRDGLPDGEENAWGTRPLVADTDMDGITDGDEVRAGLSPTLADTDGDGAADGVERMRNTNPLDPDTDRDGVLDGAEILADGDPLSDDADGDGVKDFQEIIVHFTAPRVADTDNDGIPDGVELALLLDPLDPADAALDIDLDGLTALQEVAAGTDPQAMDTDLDDLADGAEGTAGTNPLLRDTDEDGIPDGAEVRVGANPLALDSDGDGLPDAQEMFPLRDTDGDGKASLVDADSDDDGVLDGAESDPGLDPDGDGLPSVVDADADGDGAPDGEEVRHGLDPRDPADANDDPDQDGLVNLEEIQRGTNPRLADTDADGIRDNDEVTHGFDPTNPADAARDLDRDTLTNAAEIARGTDPRRVDSDGDGLMDDREVALGADPLDTDSDNDGVLDGDELTAGVDTNNNGVVGVLDPTQRQSRRPAAAAVDTDGDGIADVLERAAGTDPGARDSDGDGLSDDAELAGCRNVRDADGLVLPRPFPTDPLAADTDRDGLTDAVECGAGLDPTRADHDGDGALDGDELVDCGAGSPGCPAGTYVIRTDPLNADTDGDGVPDGYDPGPMEGDFDRDGLPDMRELVEGWNLVVNDLAPAPGEFIPGPVELAIPLSDAPWIVVAAWVGPAAPLAVGEVRVTPAPVATMEVDGASSEHALRWEGPRLLSTAPFRPASSRVTVDITGAGIRVERVLAIALPSASALRPGAGLRTLATLADTDGDGLPDGDETTNAFWLEAEHFAPTGARLVAAEGAGNGMALQMAQGLPGFALGPGPWGFKDGQLYSVFVRARRILPLRVDTAPYLLVTTVAESCDPMDPNPCVDGGACDCLGGPCVCGFPEQGQRIALRDQWDWTYVATRRARANQFDLDIRELQDPMVRWELDRVLVVEGSFSPRTYLQSYDDLSTTLDPVYRVLGMDPATPLTWNSDVPWGLADPWEADTDGDGMRASAGVLPASAGWLVDGRERALFLNGFDIDSDLDATLGGDGLTFTDAVTTLLSNGTDLAGQGGPDGRPDYADGLDPAPQPLDFDHDGLLDSVEVAGQLVRERAACATRNGCPDPAACAACPAAAFDDELDLEPLCVRQLGGAATLPLCDFADDDRDDDGIRDGDEDRNRNGRTDPGETDPNAWDSDGDCIGDGVERGLACPTAVDTLVETGIAVGCAGNFLSPAEGFRPGTRGFVPDADLGATRTNAAVVDSDADLLSDGDGSDGQSVPRPAGGFYGEDLNCNGRADPGETGASDPDTDNDLVSDGAERVLAIDPFVVDSDADRLLDGEEVLHYGTRPDLVDTDGDGLDDGAEARPRFPNPLTDPMNADTDGDGLSDGDELLGRGPLATCELRDVCGDDGTCTGPCTFGTSDPTRMDSDGDGLTDTEEMSGPSGSRTNLARVDTDGDGLSDADEIRGTGVLAPFGPTDPRRSDSDGDGFVDLVEVSWGSNPASAASKPVAFAVRPGGLFLQADDFTLVGRELVANGRVLLSCQGRPAAFAVEGSLTLTPVDGQFSVRASGDMNAITGAGDVTLWSGETLFSPSATTASAGVTSQRIGSLTIANGEVELRFDPPACNVNEDCPRGSCSAGQCTGTPGPDLVDVCDGVIEDQQLEVALPTMGTPGMDPPSYRSSLARADLVNDRADLRSLIVVGASDPADFPWVGLQCMREPTRIRFRVELGGDLSINPRFNVPTGVPAFSLDGLGSLNMPGFDMFPGIGLSAVNFDPSLGAFTFNGPSFGMGLGSPSLSGSIPPYALDSAPDAPCIYTADLAMISCKFSFKKKKRGSPGEAARTQWTFDGQVDIHRHGLIPFQYDARHTFEGIDCAQGINLCQDGQVALSGKVTVPIPKTPGIDAVVDGRVLLDVTTRDGDDLFTGFFGTLSFQQRHLAALQQSGLVTFPFPVSLEAAQATMAMVYEGDDPKHLVFQSTTGFRFADLVDTNLVPRRAFEMFDPNRSDIRGCLEIDTGRLQAKGRIFSWAFPIDAEIVMTPPFRDGQPDLRAGNIGITGSMSYPTPFGGPKATMGGTLWYDGTFRLTGTVNGALRFPGLPSLSLPSAAVTMTHDSSSVTGVLTLPGLGSLVADGTVRAGGAFNLSLTGALNLAGFRLIGVTGTASHNGGVSLQGTLMLPFSSNGDTPVRVSGTYRSPTDWSFTSDTSVGVPIAAVNLGNLRVTVSPSGVTLSSDVSIPGFASIHFAGSMTSFGGLALRGVLSQAVAGISLTGGEILLDRTDVLSGIEFTAGAYVGFGPITLGKVTILIESDGTMLATGNASYAGKGLTFTVSKGAGLGMPSASGSVSMGGCAGPVCLGGTMRVGISAGSFYAQFDTSGTSIGISSNGCVTWYIGADCGPFDSFCPDIPIKVCLL